jgi:hypothetical protein
MKSKKMRRKEHGAHIGDMSCKGKNIIKLNVNKKFWGELIAYFP